MTTHKTPTVLSGVVVPKTGCRAFSHLVGPFESRRVEEGLRSSHVRIRYAARLAVGEGQPVGEALVELVGGLVVHAVHHVQVAETEVYLDETTNEAAECE